MENILSVSNLNVYYENKQNLMNRIYGNSEKSLQHVLKNVSFSMKKGEVLGLVGESGCGKTSLAKAILGMQKRYDGEIVLNCPNPQMVFQDPYSSLNPSKKIGWILEEPLRMRARADIGKDRLSKEARETQVDQMLERVGLDVKLREHYPAELSGGQRQRVAIAAALLCGTDFLIADEPVSALDVTIQAQIIRLLLKLHEGLGISTGRFPSRGRLRRSTKIHRPTTPGSCLRRRICDQVKEGSKESGYLQGRQGRDQFM